MKLMMKITTMTTTVTMIIIFDDDDMRKLSILMKIRTSITLIIEVHFLFSIFFIRN